MLRGEDPSANPKSTLSSLELIRQLVEDSFVLLRTEIRRARTDVRRKARRIVGATALLGIGAVFGLLASVALVAALILALATVMPAPWAAVTGAAALGLAGVAMVVIGVAQLRRAFPPVAERSLESVKEDVSWVKQRARSSRKTT